MEPLPVRRVLKITLAYDGTDFAGWQIQPRRRTVQGVVQTAVSQIAGESVQLVGSGRTDAGVHAVGQVASFETTSHRSCDVFQHALNAVLPDDVAVLAVDEAPSGFHARRSARRKRYRYVIHDGGARDVFARRYCWSLPYSLDESKMQRAAAALVGRHDFKSFQSTGAELQTSVRTLYASEVTRSHAGRPHEVLIEIEADGFLYNMVRAITGTLVEVGRGGRCESSIPDLLAALDRSAAGRTAPPQGLCLLWVGYE